MRGAQERIRWAEAGKGRGSSLSGWYTGWTVGVEGGRGNPTQIVRGAPECGLQA